MGYLAEDQGCGGTVRGSRFAGDRSRSLVCICGCMTIGDGLALHNRTKTVAKSMNSMIMIVIGGDWGRP